MFHSHKPTPISTEDLSWFIMVYHAPKLVKFHRKVRGFVERSQLVPRSKTLRGSWPSLCYLTLFVYRYA